MLAAEYRMGLLKLKKASSKISFSRQLGLVARICGSPLDLISVRDLIDLPGWVVTRKGRFLSNVAHGIQYESSMDEDATFYYADFADDQFVPGIVPCTQAIGGDISGRMIRTEPNGNGCGEQISAAEKDIENEHEPQYMRINGRERLSDDAWGDPETGGAIFRTTERDIDVSEDGKHWFHLMGGFCRQHNLPYLSK